MVDTDSGNKEADGQKNEKLKPKPITPREPTMIKKEDTLTIRPAGKVAPKPIGVAEPVVIDPGKTRPVIPGLKGEPSKRLEARKKPQVRKAAQESRLLTLVMLICFVFLTGGTVLIMLQVMDITVPKWVEPIIKFYESIPFLSE